MPKNDYQPPDSDDYGNVRELNRAWLRTTTDLQGPQRARLAGAPFLLFSLREYDLEWWGAVLNDDPQSDWLRSEGSVSEPLRRVQSAALGFLWQLALRNPYAARLVSGAGVTWCELLTSVPLIVLIDRVADRPDLSVPRLERDAGTLFASDFTSSEAEVRRSSHFAALQGLLTMPARDSDQVLGAAACRMRGPRMKVADQRKE